MFFKKKIENKSVRKIAIIRRNGLGDLLCAFPLILYLKKLYPFAKLTLFVDERNAPLLPFLPPIDQVAIFPKNGNKYWNVLSTALKFFNQFDLAISAKASPMKLANLFLFFLKAKKRMAYVDNSWHSKLINESKIYDKYKAQFLHQALKNLQLIDGDIQEIDEELYPRLKVPLSIAAQHTELNQMLKDFRRDRPLFLMAATTTKFENRITEEKYAAYLNQLNRIKPISVVIVGLSKDEQRAQRISAHLSFPHLVKIHSSFEELMVIIENCSHVFVGDGGIAHISAAFGKKGVVLYGGVSPAEWAPLSKQMAIFYDASNVNLIAESEVLNALQASLST